MVTLTGKSCPNTKVSCPSKIKNPRVSSGIYSFAKQTHTPEVKHGTWKLNPWKRGFLLETIIFRFYVDLRGCTCDLVVTLTGKSCPNTKVSFPSKIKNPRVSSGIYSFAKQTHTPEAKHGTWKLNPWKRGFLLETIIFRFHVELWGGTCDLVVTLTGKSCPNTKVSFPSKIKNPRVSSGIYSFAKQTHTPEVKHGT